jgi:hypothetical protein
MIRALLILWVISVDRVYIRGMSPQMSQYPRFIDILLARSDCHSDHGPEFLRRVERAEHRLQSLFVTGMVGTSVALSTMLAFILDDHPEIIDESGTSVILWYLLVDKHPSIRHHVRDHPLVSIPSKNRD